MAPTNYLTPASGAVKSRNKMTISAEPIAVFTDFGARLRLAMEFAAAVLAAMIAVPSAADAQKCPPGGSL